MFLFNKKKPKYIVAFDVDGVLNDMQTFKITQGNVYAKRIGTELKKPNEYDTRDIFEWTVAQNESFWNIYIGIIKNVLKPRDGSYAFLKRLKDHDITIYLLDNTNEQEYNEGIKKAKSKSLIGWIKHNQLYYDKIIKVSNDRINDMKKYNIDVLVTDRKEIAEAVAARNIVYLFDNNYNSNFEAANVTRVYNLKELENLIISNKGE
jgi:uncharacterized HAD superfamily protein